MKVELYEKKDENNEILISELKKLDDLAFGFGPNIVNITREELKEFLQKGFILALRENGKIVSFISFLKEDSTWYCSGVCTHPEQQGKGLADKVIKESLNHLNGKHITATVRENNLGSLKVFIRNNGFIGTKYLKNHFGKGKDRLLMEWGPKIEEQRNNLTQDRKELDCTEKKKIEDLFNKGFILVNIEKDKLIFFKKR